MSTYRTSRMVWFMLGAMMLGMEWILFTSENQYVAKTDIEFILLAAFWPALFGLIAFGQYVEVNTREIVFVEYFFRRKRISFGKIESLAYIPTGQLGNLACALHIRPNGMQKRKEGIEISNVLFAEETVATIAKKLVQSAHHAKAEEAVTKLIEKHKTKLTMSDYWRESWKMGAGREQTIGSVGIVVCMAIFFFGLYLQDSGVKMNGPIVLIFPTSITLMLFFVGYAIHGTIKKALWYVLPTVLLLAWVGLSPAPTVYTYSCENGSQLTASFPPNGQMRIILNADNTEAHMVPVVETPDHIKSFDDGITAYTFVNGYDGQMIVTDKSGPTSTICYPKSDISHTGNIDPAVQSKIMQTIKDADAEKNYQVKTLDNEYFVSQNSITDNGQELTGYFTDGQIRRLSYNIGLSYGLHKYLFYFDNANLVYVYEEEADFPISNDGDKDYTKTEFAFGAGYFFIDGKLSMTNSKGSRRFTDDEAQDFNAMAKTYLDMLAGK